MFADPESTSYHHRGYHILVENPPSKPMEGDIRIVGLL